MRAISKRSTVYFDPLVYQALKMRADSTHTSLSELIDDAVRLLIIEDLEDIQAITDRLEDTEINYDELLNDLRVISE